MIDRVNARTILNSRGQKTIEVEVETDRAVARASAPSGASAGKFEVIPFPNGVKAAVDTVKTKIAPLLRSMDEAQQKVIDNKLLELDGTTNLSKIGGSPILATSLAVLRVAAASNDKEIHEFLNPMATSFPYPLGNIIGGGAHGGGTDIQEFLVIPLGAKNFPEAVFTNAAIHAKAKQLLAKRDKKFLSSKSDEGAWATGLPTEDILDLLCEAIREIDPKAKLGLDVAASQLWDGENYAYTRSGKNLTPGEQIDYMLELLGKYPLIYLEDPLHEEDFKGFAALTAKAGGTFICGDDLTVTNSGRLQKALDAKSINSMIIKPNQNGTVSGTLEVLDLAEEKGILRAVSHRSGETNDNTISHLALASESQLLKSGVVGGERIAKLNELIRLWEKVERPTMAKIR